MGIFSRTPQVPDPQVGIRLAEGCHEPFYPGARVHGVVTLRSPIARQIDRSQVAFLGDVETHNFRTESNGQTSSTIHYHDNAELFAFGGELEQTFTAEPGQIYEWPFDFTLPHQTASSRIGCYQRDTAKSGIYAEQVHDLPPSFKHSYSLHRYASVEYNVQAIFNLPDRKEPLIVQLQEQSLVFFPCYPQPSASLTEWTRPREQYSSSRLVGHERSFRGSFRDAFSSQTPSVHVTLKASMPREVAITAPFPIYACVELDSLSDPGIDIPSVDIHIKSMKLHPINFYRAKRVRGSSRPEHEAVNKDEVHLNAVPDRHLVSQQHREFEGRKSLYYPAAFEARIPGSMAPSFRTFNINHTFQLNVTIEVTICEKTFAQKIEIAGLVVLGSPACPENLPAPSDDGLPAYSGGPS